MREDLTKIQQSVQAAHALLEASRQGLFDALEEHPHLVLCGVSDPQSLQAEIQLLQKLGTKFTVFREPDLGNQVTAVATEALNSKARRQLRHLRLLTA